MRGTVSWFNDVKGFGFITREDGGEIYVHFSAIVDAPCQTLTVGEVVEFDAEPGPKGVEAVRVRKARAAV